MFLFRFYTSSSFMWRPLPVNSIQMLRQVRQLWNRMLRSKKSQCWTQLFILIDLCSDEVILFLCRIRSRFENLATVNNLILPNIPQLRTYLVGRQRVKYEQLTFSLGELGAWLTSYSLVRDNELEVYVIGYKLIDES